MLAALLLLVTFSTSAQQSQPIPTAKATIQRLIGKRINQVTLKYIPTTNQLDTFSYSAKGGKVTVSGNTGVAMCRGFYEYLKANNLAQVSWAGNRIALPAKFPDAALFGKASPYENRYYFNVVTYGYTLPYWNEARWQQELDWMAFHGINMPLMLVAVEAIATQVWQELGLTKAEIDAFYTGPAHLPWQRMGNIVKVDGPLPATWHADQIKLAHFLLKNMRELGMKPIVQGFSGFVPSAFTRVFPEDKLHKMSWGGFPEENMAYMLTPSSPRFATIQKKYIQAWEKEFGVCDFYLIDSFNEMELPKTGQPDSVLLAEYGDQIYKSLKAANPTATWVIQGWMIGSDRRIWTKPNLRGLLSKVPDDKMYILDEACDYNANWWHSDTNWERFDAFYNKPWGWGVIPNMGGKTAYTGVLSFYATEPARALNSSKRGRLNGFGLCPEGIENNDVLYELLCDVAWQRKAVSLDKWTTNYAMNRYGACPASVTTAWDLLQKSAYGDTFFDHPRFAWQNFNTHTTVHKSETFYKAVDAFLAASGQLSGSKLYVADAVEMSAIALGLRADEYYVKALNANKAGNAASRDSAVAVAAEILTNMDRLLESHPLNRLDRWLNFARAHGVNEAQKRSYESNARKIVTTWGAPSCWDYSARMWSGLIRDYYRERMIAYFDCAKKGIKFDRETWENNWVKGTGVSAVKKYDHPCNAAKSLLEKYAH